MQSVAIRLKMKRYVTPETGAQIVALTLSTKICTFILSLSLNHSSLVIVDFKQYIFFNLIDAIYKWVATDWHTLNQTNLAMLTDSVCDDTCIDIYRPNTVGLRQSLLPPYDLLVNDKGECTKWLRTNAKKFQLYRRRPIGISRDRRVSLYRHNVVGTVDPFLSRQHLRWWRQYYIIRTRALFHRRK